jgi:hypothetical protein
MAAIDATQFPAFGQKFRLTGRIEGNVTRNPITGGLTGIASSVSKDGGAFVATTTTATEIGSTGYFVLDLSATEMTATSIIVKVSATNANAVEFWEEIRPVVMTEIGGHWKDQSVVRLEQSLILLSAFMTNQHTLTLNSESVLARDNTTVMATGSVSGLTNSGATVTRSKMS